MSVKSFQFEKLRKQALASLHSGLQNNQGIPIAHVEKWLAMEGEDVEGLLEYHGFSIKKYEEAYMVKEGPFLSSDVDFPTKCAQLVKHKRSEKIVDDVRTALILEELLVEGECEDNVVDIFNHENPVNAEIHATPDDEKMLDNNICYTPKVLTKPSRLFEEGLPFIQYRGSEMVMEEIMPVAIKIFMPPVENVGKYAQQYDNQQILLRNDETFFNDVTLQVLESSKIQHVVHQSSSSSMKYENSASKISESEELESETLLPLFDQEEEAKKKTLILILRKWKKQAAMRRTNREQKEFLASEALSTLTLGPPIGQIQYQHSWSNELLDIDALSSARHGKIVNSWSRLNISDLVAPIMVARNPGIRFICWKLILLVQPSDPDNQIHQLALEWLFFKLLGKENDAELVLCSPGLSIWNKWSDPYGNSPQTCCLSIIRENFLDGRHEIEGDVLHGASCLVYLVSETIPWEVQRARLQNFLVSVPAGSSLPLLILSTDSSKGEFAERSVNITRSLSLHDEKEMRISSSFVTFLSDSSSLTNLPCFFDDNQLRVGLQWLANNVPTLPSLSLIRTREVVLNYLKRYMEDTANHKGFDLAPDDCIDGFNKALDKSAEEIMVTASMNPTQWPAPEIDLLDNSSYEGRMAGLYLPCTSWSSPTRIDPIIRAINSCKLRSFPDTAWLKHESHTGVQLKQQKLALEEILFNYLHESNKLLNADLAAREAGIMLQKCVVLQNCGSGYCLVPRWNLIFQRICSWQLNNLTAPGISNVFIMDNKDNLLTNDALDFGVERSSFLSFPTDVSLDELVENICCNPFEGRPIIFRSMPPRSTDGGGDAVIADEDEDGDGAEAGMNSQNRDDLIYSSSYELVPENMNTNKQIVDLPLFRNDRLTRLLERCSRVQDMIDQKLAIYF